MESKFEETTRKIIVTKLSQPQAAYRNDTIKKIKIKRRQKIHKKFLEDYIFFALLKLCFTIELYSNVKVVFFNRAFRLKSNFKIRQQNSHVRIEYVF